MPIYVKYVLPYVLCSNIQIASLLMTETTNDPPQNARLFERQQHDNMPDEYFLYNKKLLTRYGLVFYDDRIIVPKNLRTTVISLLLKGHPAINKMLLAARHF